MNNEFKSHPVLNHQMIDECGVLVVDVNSMPVGERPFQSDVMVIGICMEGSATFHYDMQPTQFVKYDVAITLPQHIFTYSSTSYDYKAILIIIAQNMFKKLIKRQSFVDYKKYHYQPSYHLTQEQFSKISDIVRVLKFVSETFHPKREETIENLLDLFFYTYTYYRGDSVESVTKVHRSEQLFSLFYDLLLANYNKHHFVTWYAGQLNLSPKYLSLAINKATGKTANQWIAIVITEQAKKLLRNRGDMTVQQIAFELGFRENAAFCRFFKDNTGLRPSQFRHT